MKNAKRILLFALALVALTLVMSLSIFAEETECEHSYSFTETIAEATLEKHGVALYTCSKCSATKEQETHSYHWNFLAADGETYIHGCPVCKTEAKLDENSTNVSSNLGYTIYYSSSWNDFTGAANTNYKVIRLTKDIASSGGYINNKNTIFDLGGFTISKTTNYAGATVRGAAGIVNGTFYKEGSHQALNIYYVDFIEDFNVIIGSEFARNATAILLSNNATYGSYIGKMKNVTIDSKRDANGNYIDNIGLFNHGLEFSNENSVIGNLENVKVYSRGQAITIMAKEIGTMTNCVFDGTNIGMNIGKLQCNINLVNCVVSSETLAVRIGNATANTLKFNFDEETAISSSGSVYYIPDNFKGYTGFESLTTAVALVNGVLYGTLEDAMAAVLASKEEVTTFTLIGDLTLNAPIEINKVVEFSFGGGTFKIPTTGDKTFTEMTAPGYTVTALNGAFVVAEGGVLTITGDGTLIGENAIVANGGNAVVEAGTYVGYNPVAFVDANACVANNDGTYTIADHKYDDGVLADKVTYGVDGVCNNCGFVRGNYAVNYVYYATLEEAIAAATESGYQIVLAADIVLDGEVVWDFTGLTFNFNGRTVTVNGTLSIVGGKFTQDVSQYVADDYCTYKNSSNYYVVETAHTWTDATCTAPKTCTACGATEGEALGHSYFYPCDKVCMVCYEITNPDATHNIVHVEAKAGTDCQSWDGNIEYWYCSDCGVAWADEANTQMINLMSVKVNGEHSYFSPCDKVCMVCNEVTNPDATHNIVHVEAKAGTDCQTWDGNIEYWYCSYCGAAWTDEALTKVTNPMSVKANGEHSYFYPCDVVCQVCHEETNPDATHNIVHAEAKAGTNCQTWDGNIEYWYCSDCGAAWTDEALTKVTNPMSVKVNGDHNYVAGEPAEDGSVTYTCDNCGDSYTESVEHTHTEVEIPAVLPTPSNAGHTAGIKCSECGEILVPTTEIPALGIDAGFKFSAANINLSESIALKFFVNIPTNYENTYIVFKFMGEEITTDVHSDDIKNGVNRHIYTFAGILPIYMGETIEATVCANVNGEIVSKTLEYSVKNYCVSVINSASSSSKFKTVVTDLLVYGAAAQVYVEPTISDEELVTSGVNLSNATQEFTKLTAEENNKLSMVGEAYDGLSWTAVNLYAKDTISMKFYFTVGSNVDVSKLQIKLEYLDEAKYIDITSLKYDNEKERYEVTFTNIWPIYYDEIVNASFVLDGVEVGKSLNYSVNTYILSNQDKVSAFGDFVRALSNYSKAVCAYAK